MALYLGSNKCNLNLNDAAEIPNISGLDTSVSEYTQMNDLVTAYLKAADAAYTDDNGDNVSVIAEYGTSENDADRPLSYPLTVKTGTLYLQSETTGKGWTLAVNDGWLSSIANATPGEVSQYLVKDSGGNLLENGRIKPTGKVRMIKFCGYIRNCRDLGGWACDGGTVKYGKLFRSAVVSSAETWIDPKISENIGIRHEIDFRDDNEANYMTESTLGSAVRYQRIPLNLYYADSINSTGADYGNMKKVLRTIIEAAIHNEGVIYHCSIGRDRTGAVTFMLLSLLGAARADIDKDYELSSFSAANTPAYRTSTTYRAMATYLSGLGGSTLRDNVVWWFIKAGFGLAELNAFRAAMTDGTPEELTAEDFTVTYTVTNYLTGCKTSNAGTSVEETAAYSATLTAQDGYELTTVTVTMGGVDVTADVYTGGVISIVAVTGDVIITAVATQVASYTNQIPISTDADGNIFNGVGYQSGYRLNGSGVATAQSGTYITGFIPCVPGDIARFEGINVASGNSAYTSVRIGFYDASKNVITAPYWSDAVSASSATFDDSGALKSLTIPTYSNGTVAFARFTSYYIDKKSIITINEEISGGGVTSNYTNLLGTLIDSDGNILDGVGYRAGKRWNSSSTTFDTTTDLEGSYLFGLLPAQDGDVIRIKAPGKTEFSGPYDQVKFFAADKSAISGYTNYNNMGDDRSISATLDASTGIVAFTINNATAERGAYAYISVVLQGITDISGVVITKNEEIS